MPTLPTDHDTLMADDFRQEITNKITAVGLYLGDDIQIPNNITPGPTVILPKVSFITRLKNGDGKWKGRWEIFDANQQSVVKSSGDFDVEKLLNTMHGVITSTMLPVTSIGFYKYVLTIENTPYEFTFEIKQ